MSEPLAKTYLSREEIDVLARALAVFMVPGVDVSTLADAHDAARAIFFDGPKIADARRFDGPTRPVTHDQLIAFSLTTHLAELRGDLTLEKERRDREAEWIAKEQARSDPGSQDPG